MIKKQTITNFSNMETAIKTYDRNASVSGTPAWRYVYHAIHSADKWFFNPSKFIQINGTTTSYEPVSDQ